MKNNCKKIVNKFGGYENTPYVYTIQQSNYEKMQLETTTYGNDTIKKSQLIGFEEMKQLLKGIKSELIAARFLHITPNKRGGKLNYQGQYKTLADFGNRMIELNEKGFNQFRIEIRNNGFFSVVDLYAVKEFEQETLNQFIARTGNHGC